MVDIIIGLLVFAEIVLAMFFAYNLKTRLKYGFLQSTILGLTISVPYIYMFGISILSWIGEQMFKVASLLGGEDLHILIGKMRADYIKSQLGDDVEVEGVFTGDLSQLEEFLKSLEEKDKSGVTDDNESDDSDR